MSLRLRDLVTPQPASFWQGALLTGLQGVTPVTQAGVTQPTLGGVVVQLGTGTVQAVGPATANANVVVEIVTSGNVGTAQFEYSLDGGVTSQGPFPIMPTVSASVGTYYLPEINVTLIFTNGAYASPSAPLDSASNASTFIGPLIATGGSPGGETYSFVASVPNFPVTNWETAGVARTLVQAEAQALAILDQRVADIAAAGFADSWVHPPPAGPPPDGWLDMLAQGVYGRSRLPGAQTQGYLLLQASAAAGPYQLKPGDLSALSANGQVFTNLQSFAIQKGGSVLALFGAATLGAGYNSVVSLNPVFTGVTAQSGTPIGSPPALGTGTVTATGVPWTWHPVVKITRSSNTTGPVTAQFDYSLDGGSTYTGTPQAVVAPVTIGPMTLSFIGSPTTSGVWNIGDTYTPGVGTLPGSNTITQLLNPLPGVTVGNYLQQSPAVATSPGATGAIALSGYPTAEVQVLIKCVVAGGVGIGKWSVTTSGANGAATRTIGAQTISGITFTPSGTFSVGDTFQFSTRWISQLGADPQTSSSLGSACQAQWGTLSPSPTTSVYEIMAQAASPEVVSAAQVLDPVVPGQIDLSLIGAGNQPVSAAAVAAVQAYVNARVPDGVSVVCSTVIPVTIAITGSDSSPHIFASSVAAQASVAAQIAANLYALQVATAPGTPLLFAKILDEMALAGTPGGIPGLLALDTGSILINGIPLNTSGGQIALAPNMVANITPPVASLYGVLGG